MELLFLNLLKKTLYGGNFWFSSLSALSNHSLGKNTLVSFALMDIRKKSKDVAPPNLVVIFWHIEKGASWLASNPTINLQLFDESLKKVSSTTASRVNTNYGPPVITSLFFSKKISIALAKWLEFFIGSFVRTNNCQIWKSTSKF